MNSRAPPPVSAVSTLASSQAAGSGEPSAHTLVLYSALPSGCVSTRTLKMYLVPNAKHPIQRIELEEAARCEIRQSNGPASVRREANPGAATHRVVPPSGLGPIPIGMTSPPQEHTDTGCVVDYPETLLDQSRGPSQAPSPRSPSTQGRRWRRGDHSSASRSATDRPRCSSGRPPPAQLR